MSDTSNVDRCDNYKNVSADELFNQKADGADKILIDDFIKMDVDNVNEDSKYKIGILILYSSKIGFIVNSFLNNNYYENNIDNKDTVLFNTEITTLRNAESKVKTNKYLYIVRYVLGEFTINQKNGRRNLTIDYNYPISVLEKYRKKDIVFLSIDNDYIYIKKTNEVAFGMNHLENIKNELTNEIKNKGYILASSFIELIQKKGINDFDKYASGVEEFIIKYLSDLFFYRKEYILNGKLYLDVILSIEEKKSDGVFISFEKEDSEIYGVISICDKRIGFINKNLLTSKDNGKSDSVIFDPRKIKVEPKGTIFKTVNDIYIVGYYVKGKKINNKTGKEHPAIDYAKPIRVFKKVSRKENYDISVLKDGILLNKYIKNNIMLDLSDDISNNIKSRINSTIEDKGFLRGSIFPQIIRECGIEDYKRYSINIKNFIDKFLSDYKYAKSISINNRTYTDVIVKRKYDVYKSEVKDINGLSKVEPVDELTIDEISILNQLYEQKEYFELLTSQALKKISFCNLPYDIMEKCFTSAKRLILSELEDPVVLNLFQKELLKARTSIEFTKMLKDKSTAFSEEIINAYIESCIADFTIPIDLGNIIKVLSKIGYSNSRNDNYQGLIERFSYCYDKLLPYLFFIRLCVQNSQALMIRCIGDYCQIVKDIRKSPVNARLNPMFKMYGFTDFLKACRKYLMNDIEIDNSTRSKITSVYIDSADIDGLRKALHFIDPECNSVEYKLTVLFDCSSWKEEQIIELLDNSISLKIFQKSIALIWERFENLDKLPMDFLKLLCWVCVDNHYTSLDEIIRFNFSSTFTRQQKYKQLLYSLDDIYDAIKKDIKMYELASYIFFIVYQNNTEKDNLEKVKKYIDMWPSQSKEILEFILLKFNHVTSDSESNFLELFKIFTLDYNGYLILQKKYALWYEENYLNEVQKVDGYNDALDMLFSKGVYEAYLKVFALAEENNYIIDLIELRMEQKTVALCELHRYSEAITFLQQDNRITNELRDSLLIKIITANFRSNGLSAKAFSVFTDSYDCNDAIKLLLENIQASKYSIITNLIAIYCNNKEYLKAMYLYIIYKSKSESGSTRLYSKFREIIKPFAGNINNHYDVIELAFISLDIKELLDFLQWTQNISIPNFKEYNAIHVFSHYYDLLLENAMNVDTWKTFLNHLQKRMDINSWMVVVCETVLKEKFDVEVSYNSGTALQSIIGKGDINKLPYNFLPYTFSYIMNSHSTSMYSETIKLLRNNDVKDRLITNNVFNDSYKDKFDVFQSYSMEEYRKTGSKECYELIVELGLNLDISDMAVIAKLSSNKSYLFNKLCDNYINNTSYSESIDIINSIAENNLSICDLEVLKLLKMIFSDDEELIINESIIFVNEEYVRRFKYDCANILRFYPKKEGLFLFENSSIDVIHKLIVFSYVLVPLYDESIYDRYIYEFNEIINKKLFYHAHLQFLKSAFYAQLEWNTTYDFIYKKWRYLKIYISYFLINEGEFEDTQIINTMIQCGHYEDIFIDSYLPFKNSIKSFWNSNVFEKIDKEYFLFSIMEGQLDFFLEEKLNYIENLKLEDKKMLSEIIYQLDFRSVNQSLYKIFISEISVSRFDKVISVTKGLSSYVYDLINTLKLYKNTKGAIDILKHTVMEEKPSVVVHKIFNLPEIDFLTHASILMPGLCSRQFDFSIFGYLRRSIISNNKKVPKIYIEKLDEYLKMGRTRYFHNICSYLYALYAAIEQKREEVNNIISDKNILDGIPVQWKKEAELIYDFAFGKNTRFVPEWSIKDNSQNSNSHKINFTFINKLGEVFKITKYKITVEESLEMFERYIDESISMWDRVYSGISLVYNYPRLEKGKREELSIPKKNNMILRIGVDALLPEIDLAVDYKMLILSELYSNRTYFNLAEDKDYLYKLYEYFKNILLNIIPIKIWVKYLDTINSFISENHLSFDYKQLHQRILIECAKLFEANISIESRYSGFKDLMLKFQGLESVYSRNILSAIQRECGKIEEGVRLYIEIVNHNQYISDKCIYFIIRNIGKKSVSLNSDDINILLKQENHPEITAKIDSIYELQPDFVTGGKIPLILSSSESKIEVEISIIKELSGGNRVIFCSNKKLMEIKPSGDSFCISRRNKYNVSSAVVDTDMLFGRNDLKEDLKYIIPLGVTVIYGPSRIGKTSLLNWVRQDYAIERGNVITILFGGEGGMGEDGDYTENFVDKKLPIPYDDDRKMTEYLLISTIEQSLTKMIQRLVKPSQKILDDDLCNRILKIIRNNDRNIIDIYFELDLLLHNEGLEIWILLDEFQKVIEIWKPKVTCEFVQICKKLLYEGEKHNIKLVICGSDDLLKHMVIVDDSVWRIAFPPNSTIAVDALEKTPFGEMIKYDKEIRTSNTLFSESAIEALYTYTGGIALYGKEICNAIIDEIIAFPDKYRDRNTIYASDVADATQKLLNIQTSELNNNIKIKEGIRKIYDAVTKNLKSDTDMQYLGYIARWLHKNPNYIGISKEDFTKKGRLIDEKGLSDAIAIAEARGIIKNISKDKNSEVRYVFRTIFYYYAFLGQAQNNLDEDLIFTKSNDEVIKNEDQPYDFHNIILRFSDYYDRYSPYEKSTFIGSLVLNSDSEVQDNLRRLIGTNVDTNGGDFVSGNKLNINIKNITNAFTILLNGDVSSTEYLNAFDEIPSLVQFISSTDFSELEEKIKYLKLVEDEDEKREIELEIEQQTEIARQSTVGTAMAAAIDTKDFFDVSDDRWFELLSVRKEELSMYLRTEIITSLGFAVMLHSVFDTIRKKSIENKYAKNMADKKLDYCPVAIMYCKVVEAMLKKLHTPIYIKRLKNSSISANSIRFGELLKEDGTIDIDNKELTIGSFSYQIVRPGKLNNIDEPEKLSYEVKSYMIQKITGIKDKDNSINSVWNEHAKSLAVIQSIRNKSAHELRPITQINFDLLIKELFRNGELLRIAMLADNEYPGN